MKVGFVSLGCAKNQVDLEYLAGAIAKDSAFIFTATPEECDYLIINTCGFIREAVQESIDTILSMRERLPKDAKLIVTGCMSERYGEELKKELPEVDFAVGVNGRERVLEYLSAKSKEIGERYLFNHPSFAYLKIAEGCDNRCSYCAIPSLRGNLKSRGVEEILKEAQSLVGKGAKELIVISQDSTKYRDGGTNFPKLMDKLSRLLPDTYFRMMYLNPDGVTEELLRTVKERENIIKYFEIPVQSASDTVLKRMNRHYTFQRVRDIFKAVKAEMPEAFIRTTVMAGFPGETEEEFEETLAFLEEYRPDFAGFFPYSSEEGTRAADFKGQVSESVVKRRIARLQKAQKKNTVARLKGLKEITFFVERENEEFPFILEGRALFQAPEIDGQLYVTEGEAAAGFGPYRGEILKVKYPDIFVKLV